jgi:hypothetical protein
VRVVLVEPDAASGLADMLHQYLEQTLVADPGKQRAARAIAGCVVFRTVEDAAVCVTMTFARDRIEVCDGTAVPGAPAISGDFLSIAHLASGQESPVRLLASRRLRVRARLVHVLLLWRVARLLRTEPDAGEAPAAVLVATFAAVAVCVAAWLWLGGG